MRLVHSTHFAIVAHVVRHRKNVSQVYVANVLKFRTLYYFCFQLKCLFSVLEFHKIDVRIANRKDLQKQSDLRLHCLSGLFGKQLMFEILEHLQKPGKCDQLI